MIQTSPPTSAASLTVYVPPLRLPAWAAHRPALSAAAKLSPAGLNSEWRVAVGGGGGFDLTLTHLIDLRIAQADYLYTTYNPGVFNNHTSTWNSVRLSAGVVFNLGNYYTAPLSAACTATPASVMAGEPVTVTVTGTNFAPKHTLVYAWTDNGGKLNSPATATTTSGLFNLRLHGIGQRGGRGGDIQNQVPSFVFTAHNLHTPF